MSVPAIVTEDPMRSFSSIFHFSDPSETACRKSSLQPMTTSSRPSPSMSPTAGADCSAPSASNFHTSVPSRTI
jgi:hypothetical protein